MVKSSEISHVQREKLIKNKLHLCKTSPIWVIRKNWYRHKSKLYINLMLGTPGCIIIDSSSQTYTYKSTSLDFLISEKSESVPTTHVILWTLQMCMYKSCCHVNFTDVHVQILLTCEFHRCACTDLISHFVDSLNVVAVCVDHDGVCVSINDI